MRSGLSLSGLTNQPMNRRIAIAALVVPAGLLAGVAFHPGAAFAATKLSRLAPATSLQGGTYTVDPAHTAVGFEIGHLGLSRVQGRFDKLEGTLHADPGNLSASSVDFTIQADSVDTNVPPRDADLRSANFFDVAVNPTITFKSTRIAKRGSGYVATGDLTMHGVTQSITIPFKAYGPITDPWKAQRIGIVSDPIVLDREAYGMKTDVPMVGSKVTVRISLEATLNK